MAGCVAGIAAGYQRNWSPFRLRLRMSRNIITLMTTMSTNATEKRQADLGLLSTTAQGTTTTLHTDGLEPGERELLSAMGIHNGCQVTVRSSGSPCIVQVESTRVGIAAHVARRVRTRTNQGHTRA